MQLGRQPISVSGRHCHRPRRAAAPDGMGRPSPRGSCQRPVGPRLGLEAPPLSEAGERFWRLVRCSEAWRGRWQPSAWLERSRIRHDHDGTLGATTTPALNRAFVGLAAVFRSDHFPRVLIANHDVGPCPRVPITSCPGSRHRIVTPQLRTLDILSARSSSRRHLGPSGHAATVPVGSLHGSPCTREGLGGLDSDRYERNALGGGSGRPHGAGQIAGRRCRPE